MAQALDITNQKFGKLTAIQKAPSRSGKTYWLCRCECGVEKEVQTSHLKNGSTQSCGSFKCKSLSSSAANIQCEICGAEFKTTSGTRKYCYECSPSYDKSSKALTIIALRKAMKKEAVKRKGGKCEKCGYDKCLGALHFHHRNPQEKDFGLGEDGVSHSWATYLNEVAKCDLLCANCHAEAHFEENN